MGYVSPNTCTLSHTYSSRLPTGFRVAAAYRIMLLVSSVIPALTSTCIWRYQGLDGIHLHGRSHATNDADPSRWSVHACSSFLCPSHPCVGRPQGYRTKGLHEQQIALFVRAVMILEYILTAYTLLQLCG